VQAPSNHQIKNILCTSRPGGLKIVAKLERLDCFRRLLASIIMHHLLSRQAISLLLPLEVNNLGALQCATILGKIKPLPYKPCNMETFRPCNPAYLILDHLLPGWKRKVVRHQRAPCWFPRILYEEGHLRYWLGSSLAELYLSIAHK